MNNNVIKKIVKKSKLEDFERNPSVYEYVDIKDYKKLKPFQYTVLLKNTKIITKIDGKKENHISLKRGDYVICGAKKEKYGISLEKVLSVYNLGNIISKPVIRKGVKLTKQNTKKKSSKSEIEITPSWGGKQFLQVGDYILMELDNKKYYGINNKAFKKTYKKIKTKKIK
uniref:Uncharacterized protein n=1 Tax=viral metagenome TaxID=1070528 RepID=A0A6C0EHN1_9ZZZZ